MGNSAKEVVKPRLTAAESEEFLQHVAQLAAAGFPLGLGFRAAADESDHPRVAQALRALADCMDQGQSLATVLANNDGWLPSHVAGLILAAVRSGRLGEALLDLVAYQRTARSLRSSLWQSLAYPLTVAALAAILLGFLGFWISYVFEHMFVEFGLMLPLATRQIFWWRDQGVWWLLAMAALLAALAVLYRRMRGRAAWTALISTFPLLGPLVAARGWAEWFGLMSILIKNQVGLSDALLWTGDGVSNAWVAQQSRRWAESATAGQLVATALGSDDDFPSGLAPLIQWGEKHGSLDQAFATGRDILERRVRLRTELLRAILPPFLFVGIGCCVLLLVSGLLMPLVGLISSLS